MKIGFIGAGKVGTSFGIYLKENEINLVGYYSKSLSSAKKSAIITHSCFYKDLSDLVQAVDIIAITTPDDVIIEIVKELIKLDKLLKDKIVFHMSGVHTSKILSPLELYNVTILSVHPLLSFSDPIKSAKELNNAFFTIEGSGYKYQEIKENLERLGNQFIEVSTENKELYHTALTVLSNYLVTLIDLGLEMLIKAGFSKQDATQIAEPLVNQTMNNIFQSNAEEALTGPISRGDIGTVNMHINNLRNANKQWLKLYKILGEHTVSIAEKSGRIDQDTVIKLREVLKNHE